MRKLKKYFLLLALIGFTALSSSCSLSSEEPVEEKQNLEEIKVKQSPRPEEPAKVVVQKTVESSANLSSASSQSKDQVEYYAGLTNNLKQNLNTNDPNDLNGVLNEIHSVRLAARGTIVETAISPYNASVAGVLGSRIGTSQQKPYDKGLYEYFSEGSLSGDPSLAVNQAPKLPPRVYTPETVQSEELSLMLESVEQSTHFFTLKIKLKNNKNVSQLMTLNDVRLVNRSEKVLKPEDQGNRWKVPGEYDVYRFEKGVPGWSVSNSGQVYRQFAPGEEVIVKLNIDGTPNFKDNKYSLMLSCNTSSFMFNSVYPSDNYVMPARLPTQQ